MIERLFRQLLEWAAGHHDEGRYSPVGIGFHWVMAGLVIFQLGWGWWMGRQPVGGAMMGAYDLHFAIGVLMLILVIGRLSWRLMAPDVINDADKPGWEGVASIITPPPTPDPACDKDDISNLALVETPKCGSWCRYGKPRGSRIPTTARACAIGRPRHPRAVVSLIRGRESGRVRERCYYTT